MRSNLSKNTLGKLSLFLILMTLLAFVSFRGVEDLLIDADDHDYFKAASGVDTGSSLSLPLGEPLVNSGVIYLDQEKYDIAEEKFNQALLKDQTLWQAYQGLAEVFEQRGKWKEAIERYRNILELNPSNQNARERIDELIRKHNTE